MRTRHPSDVIAKPVMGWPTVLLACLTAAMLTACGGGDDDPLPADTSTDVVAKYMGSWLSRCVNKDGASAEIRADFTKASANSFTGKVVAYAYVGSGCSGLKIKTEDVLTGLSMTHAGTGKAGGMPVDRFVGSSKQGNGKLVLYTDGNTLLVGDPDASKDADGYPTSFLEESLSRI